MTPDGPPILGPCRVKNLTLNTGHGHMGWTMAAGSARIVADMIDSKAPEIDVSGMTLDRY
jgi:D-amino-acid dehydrogenase